MPVAEPEAAVKPEPDRREIAPASRSYKILLVEDDVLVALGVTAVLEDMGHQATRAMDGRRRLSILNAGEAFDLVITDYAMPGMTGLELAHAIKASWPALPVVLATGYAELPTGSAPIGMSPPVQAVPAGRSGRDSWPKSWNRPDGRSPVGPVGLRWLSMGQQHRNIRHGQDMAGRTAEHHLPEPALGIGALDEQIDFQ